MSLCLSFKAVLRLRLALPFVLLLATHADSGSVLLLLHGKNTTHPRCPSGSQKKFCPCPKDCFGPIFCISNRNKDLLQSCPDMYSGNDFGCIRPTSAAGRTDSGGVSSKERMSECYKVLTADPYDNYYLDQVQQFHLNLSSTSSGFKASCSLRLQDLKNKTSEIHYMMFYRLILSLVLDGNQTTRHRVIILKQSYLPSSHVVIEHQHVWPIGNKGRVACLLQTSLYVLHQEQSLPTHTVKEMKGFANVSDAAHLEIYIGGGGAAFVLIGLLIAVVVAVVVKRRKRKVTLILKNEAESKLRGNDYNDKVASFDDDNPKLENLKLAWSGANNPSPTTAISNVRYSVQVPHTAKPFDLPKSRFRVTKVIGGGHYGIVSHAVLLPSMTEVAAKTLKATATVSDMQDLVMEAYLMMAIGQHETVLSLVAPCLTARPPIVMTEWCQKGDLRSYLQRNASPTSQRTSLQMCFDISNGMCYLVGKKVVHRDLAARNVLVTADLRCKVADFGLSRQSKNDQEYYRTRHSHALATRWLAPEIAVTGKFTEATDVWAYGITLWEIYTRGALPYENIASNCVIQAVTNGTRLNKPPEMPTAIYSVMISCWIAPEKRPGFQSIACQLNALRQEDTCDLKNKVGS